MPEHEEPLEIEADASAGVYSTAYSACAQIGELTSDALFSLDLESSDGPRKLGIEASFGLQLGRRVLTRIGVQVHDSDPSGEMGEAMLRDAVERFGGVGFVNVCASPPADAAHEIDVTVSAGSVRWLSEITLLSPSGEPSELRAAYEEMLRALGLDARVRGGRLALPHRKLAAPPDARAQAAAFAVARRHALSVTLYSAAIPATRALRVAEISAGEDKPPAQRQWYLGMGLSGGVVCTEADVVALQRYVEERTHARFSGRRWSVRVGPADELPPRQERPRRGLGFSFFFKPNR
jgi:hypothetical protein